MKGVGLRLQQTILTSMQPSNEINEFILFANSLLLQLVQLLLVILISCIYLDRQLFFQPLLDDCVDIISVLVPIGHDHLVYVVIRVIIFLVVVFATIVVTSHNPTIIVLKSVTELASTSGVIISRSSLFVISRTHS